MLRWLLIYLVPTLLRGMLIVFVLMTSTVWAQVVPKTVLVEHIVGSVPGVIPEIGQFAADYGTRDVILIQYQVDVTQDNSYSVREDFYGVNYPETVIVSGNPFMQTDDLMDIEVRTEHELEHDAPVFMFVDKMVDENTLTLSGSITALGDFAGTYTLYIAVVEKSHPLIGENSVGVRKMLPTSSGTEFFIEAGGENAFYEFEESVEIDDDWDMEKVEGVVFIQDPETKEVFHTITTETPPEAAMRYASGQRYLVRPDTSDFMNQNDYYGRLANFSAETDTFHFSLEKNIPEGWMASYCVGPLCFFDDASLEFEADAIEEFHATISPPFESPGISGVGSVTLTVTSNNHPEIQKSMTFTLSTNDRDVLVVDADGGLESETAIYAALDQAMLNYAVWHVGTDIILEEMLPFKAVIWNTGRAATTLRPWERDVIEEYLNQANDPHLLIMGQDIGFDLGSEFTGNEDVGFLTGVLQANYINHTASEMSVEGIQGHDISGGLAFNLVDQTSPDVIEPANDNTFDLFHYTETEVAGIQSTRVVYLGFDAGRIDDDLQLHLLIARTMAYFGLAPTDVKPEKQAVSVPRTTTLHQNVPNPFNPTTSIRYELAQNCQVNLAIYDVTGKLVKTLVADGQDAGVYDVQWNGTDDNGRSVNSGVYLYQLKTDENTHARKMILLK